MSRAPRPRSTVEEQAAEADDLVALPVPARPSGRALTVAVVAIGGAFAALFVLGWLPRQRRIEAAAAASQESGGATPRTEVVKPRPGGSTQAIRITGGVEPLRDTVVHARASGYVRKWFHDIGDKVKAGDALADLDTPELDQELAQAKATLASRRASLEQARADLAFAKVQTRRFEALAPSGVAAQQDVEDKQTRQAVGEANLHAAEAALAAQDAAVKRLEDLRSFARVVAPYAGVVTERHVEQGTLVNAGTGGGPGLFRVVSADPVRVFVQVPQDLAPSVRTGDKARVTVREYPGRTFVGKVTRTAGALDAASRTLRTEVQLPNGDGALLAGMFAEVAIDLPSPHRTLLVPATALIVDSHGVRVAVVEAGDTIKLVPVSVERDTGADALIVGGLEGGERIVVTPGEATVEGAKVVPVERPKGG